MSDSPATRSLDRNDHDYRLMAHLLRRAGFGAPPDVIERCVRQGYEATVDELLHPEKFPDDLDDVFERHKPQWASLIVPVDGECWWIYRIMQTQRPLEEKMTLFWHDHFATSYDKVKSIRLMWRQYETLREHCLGNFGDMVKAVSRDPAMILWLDNNTNKKNSPNENYGRELLELFTLGRGNYTEADMRSSARSFTGWTFNPRTYEFVLETNQHDDGEKEFFGHKGNFNGDDIIDIVVDHPATAHHICEKLYKFFVADTPDDRAVKQLAATYLKSNHDILAVMRALFLSDFFRAETCWFQKVKNPPEFVFGALRTLGGYAPEPAVAFALREMGMELFNPPNVAGWHGGTNWIDTATLLQRINSVPLLLRTDSRPVLVDTLKSLRADGDKPTPEALVDSLLHLLGPLEVSARSRQALLDYTQTEFSGPPARRPRVRFEKISNLLQIVMALPEYQMA